MIIPLKSKQATLRLAGGKGMNLSRLVRAGFPVPDGFILTTDAYHNFVTSNDLEEVIADRIKDLTANDPASLEVSSSAIRDRFLAGSIPKTIVTGLLAAYANLACSANAKCQLIGNEEINAQCAVAVRSSATAEDLPDLSFAGQQDTFLNVIGEEALLVSVKKCWSSLWTARAIGYRHHNQIPMEGIALAIIVQAMVPSEVSGVLFTANPLNGNRLETVIDATLGLGEAIVSGQVEPDHYVARPAAGLIVNKTIGSKGLLIRGHSGGGTISEISEVSAGQALPDENILELAKLGREVQWLFKSPQDVEWAWASSQLWLLQSRPVTSLYPLIEGFEPETQPVRAMFSFGAVQGFLEPMTSLGQDNIRAIFAGAARLFDFDLTVETQRVIFSAGERLFADITSLLRHPMGCRFAHYAMKFVEPGSAIVIGSLIDDPRFQKSKGWFRFHTAKRVGQFLMPVGLQFFRVMHHPNRQRLKFQDAAAKLVSDFSQRIKMVDSFAERIAIYETAISGVFPYLLPIFVPAIGASMASLNILNRLAVGEGWANALAVTRGLPFNVTTEMDLALWETAVSIKRDIDSKTLFETEDGRGLAQMYIAGQLPPAAQTAVAIFLNQYGTRGIGEIDLGQVRWQEDPTQIMQVLGSYLQIMDPALAPDSVFRRSQKEAIESISELERLVRHGLFGHLRAKIVRMAARRVRKLGGLRETPKFTIIRIMGLVRESLLDSGRQLVKSGILNQADDLFFLRLSELKRLAAGEKDDWSSLVAGRRLNVEREKRRRQIPRILLSDGEAYYEGRASIEQFTNGDLQGSPVSPGIVEGIVHVVLDPKGVQLLPGEILVCPGTDPAWTPLFLSAGGLVMEVGGLMTHGSVVAREYGIPAVVGVFDATTRLRNGQKICVDGSSGKIELL